MIKGTKEELDDIVGKYGCPEHPDNVLTVAWHKVDNCYVIRCGDHYPEEVKPIPSRTELYKRGELEAVDKSFSLLPQYDLETGEILAPDLLAKLVAYARRYGLDAYRGHAVLMHGKPYIGLDGYLYHARQAGIAYSLTGRILTNDELTSMGYEAGDLGWRSHVRLLDTSQDFEGYGFVTKKERTEMSWKHPDKHRSPVVANHPWLLCVKRGDWQALRRAFPIGGEVET